MLSSGLPVDADAIVKRIGHLLKRPCRRLTRDEGNPILVKAAVSIIMPCYNSAATVEEAVESVRAQTHGGWELIVVDDGSTDESAEIVERICRADGRIRLIRQANRGLGAARNAGLAAAGAEFVNFLDADDLLMPNMLALLMRYFCDGLDVGVCGWTISDQMLEDRTWTAAASLVDNFFERLACGNFAPCHAVIVRRSLFSEVGGFDETLKHCQDWDMWCRIARSGARFFGVPDSAVVYRMVPHSLSRHPMSFFDAGLLVMKRTRTEDDRVRKPRARYRCGAGTPIGQCVMNWGVRCAAFAIAKRDIETARRVIQRTCEEAGGMVDAEAFGSMADEVCFASATPRRFAPDVIARYRTELQQLLDLVERDTGVSGFSRRAMKVVLHSVGATGIRRKWRAVIGRERRRRLLHNLAVFWRGCRPQPPRVVIG